MTMTTERYMNQLLSNISPLITVPTLPFNHTDRDLMRLRHHARICDDIALALKQTSAHVKSLINAGASPIFRLPNEILSEIMLWACDIAELTSFRPLKYQRFGTHLSPMVLGQVCHQWRKVSRGDPRLWTFLWVDLTFQTSERDVKRVEHWFRMSKELSVTINITQNDDTRLTDEAYSEKLLPDWQPCRRVLKTLFNHSPRIGSLFFGIMDGGWRELLRTPLNFANLRHLTINNELDPVFPPIPLLIFSNTPRLQSVDLWAADPRTLRISWGKVTSLRCSWTALADLVTTLRLCPNLKSLSIRNIENSGEHDELISQRDPVHLPKLHTLQVTDEFTNEHHFSLFKTLRCPSLANFKYNSSGPRTDSTILIPHLVPFLNQTDRLISFDAPGILLKRDDIQTLLRAVPTLHHLALDFRNAWDIHDSTAIELVTLLHQRTDQCGSGMLPQLRYLELDIDLKLSFDGLLSAFETRFPKILSLNTAHGCYRWRSSSSLGGDPASGKNELGSGLDFARLNIHTPAGQVTPAEWKFWLDSLYQRGLPLQLDTPFTKTVIAPPPLRTCTFNFVNVI